jgi:hypothetical protein
VIKVQIFHESDDGGSILLGEIAITRLDEEAEISDYSCRFAVERGGSAVGLHQRTITGYGRTKGNVLGLLFAALAQLSPEEMELEGDIGQPDVARRRKGIVPEIQAWTSRLRNH